MVKAWIAPAVKRLIERLGEVALFSIAEFAGDFNALPATLDQQGRCAARAFGEADMQPARFQLGFLAVPGGAGADDAQAAFGQQHQFNGTAGTNMQTEQPGGEQ